ncbi:hypothetical protein APR12_004942 [Nocardia amikacinitolerans]|uniref:hypothetical protein n=1 Tax=Nocardia amikacinitolerans TaxID=756689 RepID=UPI00082EA945|nr:hypothetical protein [Nocardia amikacinitolerans]MCP2319573.1 hypothetical protein [Nocardia amikacinitolerans]
MPVTIALIVFLAAVVLSALWGMPWLLRDTDQRAAPFADTVELPVVLPIGHDRRKTMTPPLAHRIMQEHMHCPITVCPVKQQARAYLIQTKRYVPQSNSCARFGF